MNKKGFTLLELLTSLSLTAIVFVLIFEVIFSLKDMYVNDSAKTEILIKKTNIADRINSAFNNTDGSTTINAIRDCDVKNANCIKFIMVDGSNHELHLNRDKNIIKFGDFSTKLSGSTSIYDDLNICYYYNLSDSNLNYDTFVKIRIPIEDNLLEENFDIVIIYQYNGDDYESLLGEIDSENGLVTTYIPHC